MFRTIKPRNVPHFKPVRNGKRIAFAGAAFELENDDVKD